MAVGDTIRSPVWGNQKFQVTQEFGVPGADPSLYDYASSYGYPAGTHIGLDIGMPAGTPLYAEHAGNVIFAGFDDSFRPYHVNVQDVDDPNTPGDETGYVEIYGHMSKKPFVGTGQTVRQLEELGVSGEETQRGSTTVFDDPRTGAHLHFELRRPGANTPSGFEAVDPTQWLEYNPAIDPTAGGGGTDLVDETGNAVGNIPNAVGGTLGNLLPTATDFLQRGAIVVLGILVLAIGLIVLLRPERFIK